MLANHKPQSDAIMIALGQIVRGYAQNNSLSITELTQAIHSLYSTLNNLHCKAYYNVGASPTVPKEESIQDDYLICLEDGKKLKMLKRHLRTTYQMSPEQYKERWGLPVDYPMVAPNYALKRSTLAKRNGLGRGRKNSNTNVYSTPTLVNG
ncbi:transcriptional regulatory protein ros [Holospora obtusa F1]|uniref:Transcriptional regulatory protein ros n=1 Tax=Holospora obtusa F1 TaxID=1399147 RepID=W6TE69_HOLOB|nr:MucR family transcriptional regulator [Holospora obtusa]ETZ07221.1 transcriptional regulatory protein ros [Holospora obtusa F1]